MASRTPTPPLTDPAEAPRTRTSRLLRNAGIVVGLAWLLGLVAFLLLELASAGDLAGLLFVGGLLVAGGLLLGSVLLDRRSALKDDPYREVDK